MNYNDTVFILWPEEPEKLFSLPLSLLFTVAYISGCLIFNTIVDLTVLMLLYEN